MFPNSLGPAPSSKINTRRPGLTYKCLALAWLISSQLSLNSPICLLCLGFYLFSFYTLFFFCGWLCGWPLASSSPSPFLPKNRPSFCLAPTKEPLLPLLSVVAQPPDPRLILFNQTNVPHLFMADKSQKQLNTPLHSSITFRSRGFIPCPFPCKQQPSSYLGQHRWHAWWRTLWD